MLHRRQFSIRTRLTPDQARSRLLGAIAPVPRPILERDSRPFVGTMDGATFRIMRASRGRSSFRPLVRGQIESDPGGSRIAVAMGVHPAVMVFVGFLLVLPASLLVSVLAGGTATDRRDPVMVAIPGVILIFLTVVVLAFFWESRRTLADLAAIVEGDASTPVRDRATVPGV